MKSFDFKASKDMSEAIVQAIDATLAQYPADDFERLLHANLHLINVRIKMRLLKGVDKVSLKLEPHEAIAFRMLFVEYLPDPTTYLGAFLHATSNKIDQHYSTINHSYVTSTRLLS